MHRLVLVGGGHAHLAVLASLVESPRPPGEVVLVSEDRHHWYSGRVPAHLRGELEPRELQFDLAALARGAGVEFVEARAAAICRAPGSGYLVHLEGEPDDPLRAAALSLDVGSVPRGARLPGVAEHALAVRPMARARELRERLDAVTRDRPRDTEVPAVVVGGGAAGVEVALALHARITELGRSPAVRILEAGPHILPGWRPKARRRAMDILRRRGVEVETGIRVVEVEPHAVVVERDVGGLQSAPRAGPVREPGLLAVWLTGAAPPPLLAASELPLDDDGYLEVDTTLRATDGAPVWGGGDCISVAGHPPLPKAGVQPVRQGPVLAANLRAHLEGAGDADDGSGKAGEAGGAESDGASAGKAGSRGAPPRHFEPDPTFLALLDTSDGRALLRWRGLCLHTRWARWLKDRIDGRFVERYRSLES